MFNSIADMVAVAETKGQRLAEVVIQAEAEQSQADPADLRQRMQRRLEVMRRSADQGLTTPVMSLSGISGGNAHKFWHWLEEQEPLTGPILSRAVARAMAVNEVNAGMGCIVATPTAGSAGILPAVLLTLQEARSFSDQQLVDALFTASGIGAVIVFRAHVSGAAGGCQAETGSAAAMAAGAAVELLGGAPRQSAQAVAITMKNMLGLVCDPVAGLVEVPCVKRNAAGAAQCLVAVDLALAGVESVIPPDEVIDAMANIGRRMDARFKETAQGGLAATPTGRKLAELVWAEKRPVGQEQDKTAG
jgi:L-serine dehydratase